MILNKLLIRISSLELKQEKLYKILKEGTINIKYKIYRIKVIPI